MAHNLHKSFFARGMGISRGSPMESRRHTLATSNLERAVFVEACQDGWNPRTVVRQLVWSGESFHEELTVFPSLREALAYAQRAFGTEDGPEPSPA